MPTRPASIANPRPTGGLSKPTPTANAAALAEWPDGNEYDVSEAPDYTLSAQLQSATGTQEPVEFRACGEGCFVAALDQGGPDGMRCDESGRLFDDG